MRNVVQQPRPTLRVVASHESAQARTAAESVFDHWVYMLRKDRNRCALGPSRKKIIEKALGLYPLDTLLLSIDGCAASAWHGGDNDRNQAYNDITLILRDEEHIERFAEWGYALRERAAGEARSQAAPASIEPPSDPTAIAAARERTRDLAFRLRGRAR